MYTIYGVPASSGISAGHARVLTRSADNPALERPWSLDPEAEISFFHRTLRLFSERLRQTANPSLDQQRDLYGATAGYLTSKDNVAAVIEYIRSGDTAAMAARLVYIQGLKRFRFVTSADDPSSTQELRALELLLREFVQALFMRGITITDMPTLTEDTVIVAKALTPAQLLSLDTRFVKGVILEQGRAFGHLATALRELSIPSVFGAVGAGEISNGSQLLIDGNAGCVTVDASFETCEAAIARQGFFNDPADDDSILPLTVSCSVGASQSRRINSSYTNYGLGLLRSEFLFLSWDHEPEEQEMLERFSAIIRPIRPGFPVTARTFDFAGDKKPMFKLHTDNHGPLRGYGACVSSILLKKQLRALMQADPSKKIRIVFPLVTRLSEALYLKKLASDCHTELENEHKSHSDYELALMIETPAAVLSAEAFAGEFSMFIIGTSSLAEYACAPRPDDSSFTPPLAKLIVTAAKAAYNSGIPIGVAGRFAGRAELMAFFWHIGVSYVSVDCYEIASLRTAVERLDLGSKKPFFDKTLYDKVMNIFRGQEISALINNLNA